MGRKKKLEPLPAVSSAWLRRRASSSSASAKVEPEAAGEEQPKAAAGPSSSSSSDGAQAEGRSQGLGPPAVLACERSRRRRRDAMLSIFRSIPTQMDYKGQKLAEQIFQGIILFSAVIGFICGYITEQFGWTVYIVMAGFALSCLLTLPPWPIYRRNPLKWLPVQEVPTEDKKPADRKVKRHPKN